MESYPLIDMFYNDNHGTMGSVAYRSKIKITFTIAIDPINMKRSGIVIGANAGKTRVDGGLWIGRAKSIHPDAWGIRWESSMKPYDAHEVFELLDPNCRFRCNGRNGGHDISFMRDHQNQNL